MISEELLAILRCPLDPSKTRLLLEGDKLACERCTLRFPIKDGFPVLVAEEALLPEGCTSLSQLPCQQEARAAGASSAAPNAGSTSSTSPASADESRAGD